MKLFFRIILLVFCSYSAYSQVYSSKNKKAIILFEEAKGKMERRMYTEAMVSLDEAIVKDDKFIEAYMARATISKILRDIPKSKEDLLKVTELIKDGNYYALACFKLAEIFLSEGKYTDAKVYYTLFLSFKFNDTMLNKMSEKALKVCVFGEEALKNPLPFVPKMLPKEVNALPIQYFPSVTADLSKMIFVGLKSFMKDEDIFISEFIDNQWTMAKLISANINTNENEGTCCISGDGKTIVFASCGRKDSYGGCDLYVTKLEGTNWSLPKNMGANINTRDWESQPSLSPDGKRMYFASTRKSGWGKEDIYVAEMKEDGTWNPAKNLGPKINTAESDIAPFIHSNSQTLYFATSGRLGMGGFDLFKTELDDTLAWSEPVNLGYPLNTANDEMSIVITSNDSKGFFSKEISQKEQTFSLIYEFEVPEKIKPSIKSTYFKGVVYDSKTKKILSADIEVIDLKTNKNVSRLKSDIVNGSYLVSLSEGKEYAFYVTKDGYLFKSMALNYKNKQSLDKKSLDIYLDPCEKGVSIVLNNLFFESNKYDLQDKSITELEKVAKFMKSNPTQKIQISGHTDDIGSDKANLLLSQNRAKAVFEQLIKLECDSARLKYQGFGETQPSKPNVSDENRAINRRIELVLF